MGASSYNFSSKWGASRYPDGGVLMGQPGRGQRRNIPDFRLAFRVLKLHRLFRAGHGESLNLETAVGCARVCRERRAWQGETKQRTPVRNEEQRSLARQARCNRAHSAVTQKVIVIEDEKVNIHAVLAMITSGQLLFLG